MYFHGKQGGVASAATGIIFFPSALTVRCILRKLRHYIVASHKACYNLLLITDCSLALCFMLDVSVVLNAPF